MALTAKEGAEPSAGRIAICTPVTTGHGLWGQVVHGFEVQLDKTRVYTGYPVACHCGLKAEPVPKEQMECWHTHLLSFDDVDSQKCASCGTTCEKVGDIW